MIAECPHRKLLVVDDEPLVRETLNFCLRDEYDVTTAASGEEAIELSRREDFPVVILDLRMEGLSGIDTLKKLKEIHEVQNVIILTAYESTETAITALNLGAFNYLTKPFERTQLMDVISRGFESYDQQNLRQQDIQQRLMNVHDSFLSLLCHEFNTPLNVILGFSELLGDSLRDPEQRAWVDDIRKSGTHLHDILMEIVDYIGASHMATTGVEKEFALGTLLQPMIRHFQEEGVRIDLSGDPSLNQQLRGPSNSVFMIVRKLVRMASHQSKHVQIRSIVNTTEGKEGSPLNIVVSGTGISLDRISRHEIEQLFKPYQFTPHNVSGSRTSLGLELATCRKIAEYARGSVKCHLTPKGEIEFCADIPIRAISA
ncbi:HAMP domain-containing sensor histidine kinase [soil metagenome]